MIGNLTLGRAREDGQEQLPALLLAVCRPLVLWGNQPIVKTAIWRCSGGVKKWIFSYSTVWLCFFNSKRARAR